MGYDRDASTYVISANNANTYRAVVDNVSTVAGKDDVVSIDPGAGAEGVIASAAKQKVIARTADDQFIGRGAEKCILPACSCVACARWRSRYGVGLHHPIADR